MKFSILNQVGVGGRYINIRSTMNAFIIQQSRGRPRLCVFSPPLFLSVSCNECVWKAVRESIDNDISGIIEANIVLSDHRCPDDLSIALEHIQKRRYLDRGTEHKHNIE